MTLATPPRAVSAQAVALTEGFYAWEVRGRGWDVYDFPVALEPPFRPVWVAREF